jgi:hypothetical protein
VDGGLNLKKIENDKMFKLIVAGGRDFNDYDLLKSKLDKLLQNKTDVEIVCGKARGADSLGERYGKEMGYPIKEFPANWNKYGKSAGYIRNKEMAEYADGCVCFWDGKSKGTGHMIDLAKEKNLDLRVVNYIF